MTTTPARKSPPTSSGKRFDSTALGTVQKTMVRYLLNHIGTETFTRADWIGTLDAFGQCAYCEDQEPRQKDHAVAVNSTQLGEHRLGNLVPACASCNGAKGRRHYREYLEGRYGQQSSEALGRLAAIEAHMEKHSYRPLTNRTDVSDLLELARKETEAVAAKYIALINDAARSSQRLGDH